MLTIAGMLTGFITGYVLVPVYASLRRARNEALASGKDTAVDADVVIVPTYAGMSFRPTVPALVVAVCCAATFAALLTALDPSPTLGVALIGFLGVAALLAVIDQIIFRLPLPLVLLAALWVAAVTPITQIVEQETVTVAPMLAGAATSIALFAFVYVASSGKMGFGDVTLALPLGLLLGSAAPTPLDAVSLALTGMLLGSVTLVAVVAGGFAVRRLRTHNSEEKASPSYTPYGPSLIAGTVIALLLA